VSQAVPSHFSIDVLLISEAMQEYSIFSQQPQASRIDIAIE